jgi:hypothetical protein
MSTVAQTKPKTDWKRYRLSNIAPEKATKLKVAVLDGQIATLSPDTTTENIKLLDLAKRHYDSLEDFRKRRRRVMKYLRGDQWHEMMPDPDNKGEYIKEEDYLRSQGKMPLKQNILSQIKNNLVGRFRTNQMRPIVIARDKEDTLRTEMLSNALRASHDMNHIKELDARMFEEFLMSGLPVQKIGYKYWKTRNLEDAFVQNVNDNRIFFNSDISDVRLLDLRMIGEVLELPIDDLIGVFARNDADENLIRRWYPGYGRDIDGYTGHEKGLSSDRLSLVDFYAPSDSNKCIVVEMWYLKSEWRVYAHDYLEGEYFITKDTMEDIAAENQRRIAEAGEFGIPPEEVPLIDAERKYESFWYVKYLTPYGHTLYEGETPFAHEEHPYSIVAYPLIDGEVWGPFEEYIDNQRYINRLISMMDNIIGSSAKGVLLVPEEVIPDDMDIDDFAEEWTKFNGVIKIKLKPGAEMPKQVTSQASVVGISDMLQIQLKLLQEISGVNYAVQGQRASSSTPASLYAQEAANSAVNSKDIMDTFTHFIGKRDYKLLKVIHQFYDEKRMLSIAGDYYAEAAKEYDPDAVRDLDFDVTMAQTIDTPAFRQVTDEFMLRMLEGQLIDIETYLEHSTMPFAQALLDTVRQKKEAMEKGQGVQGGLPPELQQQPKLDPNVEKFLGKGLQKQGQ